MKKFQDVSEKKLNVKCELIQLIILKLKRMILRVILAIRRKPMVASTEGLKEKTRREANTTVTAS